MPFYDANKNCPLCGQNAKNKFIKDYKNDDGKFSLYECLTCGGQFWLPFKNPGASWYEQGDSYNIKDESNPRQIHSYHKKFLEIHGNKINGTKMLDLGCGTGEFMSKLKKGGANVYGADIDKDSVRIAKNLYGLNNIYNLPINNFFNEFRESQFDYITAFEFFEHIDNPWIILNESKKLLKSNGKLIMSIPTRERPLVDLVGWDYPYHHLSRWDEKSIKHILTFFGYKKINLIYINKFHQLYEVFLEIIAKKLKFKKAKKLKRISNEEKNANNKESSGNFLKKILIKTVYKTGRFIGVVLVPYTATVIFFPISYIFFPRSGIMYIEASI